METSNRPRKEKKTKPVSFFSLEKKKLTIFLTVSVKVLKINALLAYEQQHFYAL